jgi:hypothetical protein
MKTILIVLFTLLSFSVFSQDENPVIVPDRPGNCTGAMIVPKQYFQIEYGIGYSDKVTNIAQFRRAFNKRFEIKLTGSFYGNDLVGVGAGTKFSILQETKILPFVSGLATIDLYNDVALGSCYAPSVVLILQKNLCDNWVVTGNVGTVYLSGEDKTHIGYGLNVGYMFEKVTPIVEYYRAYDKTQYGFAGLSYTLLDNLAIDGGVYLNLNENCDFARTELGIAWRFNTK